MSHDADRELVERYDADASAYRELWAPVLLLASSKLLEAVGGPPPRRIVDIGAGVGALLPELRRRFADAEFVGLDRSRGMLRLGPSEMPRVVADAMQLPLGDGCADLALMVFMLFHVPSPLQALREARRILRPGGRVATITWAAEMTSGAGKAWQKCLDALGPPPPASPGHERVDTSAKVSDLLCSAGFDSVRVWEAGLSTTFTCDEFVRLKTGVGSDKRRLQALAPPQRERFMAAALADLKGLASQAFRASGTVIYGVGCLGSYYAPSLRVLLFPCGPPYSLKGSRITTWTKPQSRTSLTMQHQTQSTIGPDPQQTWRQPPPSVSHPEMMMRAIRAEDEKNSATGTEAHRRRDFR